MEPRYVSLCPSTTETLFDLGVGDHVVGATKFCVHPAGELASVPRVGGTKDPRLPRIAELRPTAIFANEEENRLEDVEALRDLGLVVHTSFPKRVDDVPAVLRELGGWVQRPEAARAWARKIERAAEGARAAAAGRAPVRFLVLIWRGPWMGASGDTFLSDVLETVGGANVIGRGGPRYPEIGPKVLRELRPDVVLLPSEPFPFREAHARELASEVKLPPESIRLCDGELLSWHGSRTLRSLAACGDWLR